MMQMKGSFVALATPFDPSGQIDWKCFEKRVQWQIDQGTDGLVCFGTTGEGIALSLAEKERIAKVSLEISNGKVPVIANTGVADTKTSVLLTEKMAKLKLSGCLAVTPYYNKPSQRGCVLHFAEIAKVGLPVIVYNNPGRSKVLLEPETVAEIAEIPNVLGYKDSTGDLGIVRKIKELTDLAIFSGDDDLTFETLKIGGAGAISVIGNLIPKIWKEMISLALDGKWEASKGIAERMRPLLKALFLESNPQCLKFAMSWLGMCDKTLRLPLVEPLEFNQRAIKEAVLEISLPFFKARSRAA